MAYNESIIAYFGGDTKGLQAAIGQSQILLKGFGSMAQKAIGAIGKGFGAALATGALVQGFIAATNAAQQLRDKAYEVGDAVDSQTMALARSGDALDNVQMLGVRAFGHIAEFVQNATLYVAGLTVGFDVAADAAIRLMKEVDPAKLAAAQKKLTAAQNDASKAGISDLEKLNVLTMENFALRQKAGDETLNELQRMGVLIELERNRKNLREVTQRVDTKAAAEREAALKKEGEESVKWYKERVSLEQKLHEQKLEGMKDEERIVALSKDIADLKKQQKGHDKDSNEYMTLAVEIGQKTKDIDEARADIAAEIVRQKEAEAAAAKAAAIEAAKQLAQYKEMLHIGAISGERLNDASPETLEEIVRRNKEELFKINMTDNRVNPGGGASSGQLEARARIEQEILNVQRELEFRRNLQADYALGGEALARQRFQGDPLKFDQVLAQIVKGQSTDEKTLVTLNKFEELLRRGVPVVFNGGGT